MNYEKVRSYKPAKYMHEGGREGFFLDYGEATKFYSSSFSHSLGPINSVVDEAGNQGFFVFKSREDLEDLLGKAGLTEEVGKGTVIVRP